MTVMEERFELASQRILEIEKEKRMPEQFQRYFAENADYLGVLLEEYKWVASGGDAGSLSARAGTAQRKLLHRPDGTQL